MCKYDVVLTLMTLDCVMALCSLPAAVPSVECGLQGACASLKAMIPAVTEETDAAAKHSFFFGFVTLEPAEDMH